MMSKLKFAVGAAALIAYSLPVSTIAVSQPNSYNCANTNPFDQVPPFANGDIMTVPFGDIQTWSAKIGVATGRSVTFPESATSYLRLRLDANYCGHIETHFANGSGRIIGRIIVPVVNSTNAEDSSYIWLDKKGSGANPWQVVLVPLPSTKTSRTPLVLEFVPDPTGTKWGLACVFQPSTNGIPGCWAKYQNQDYHLFLAAPFLKGYFMSVKFP